MAEIAPFQGIVYNQEKVEDMGNIVAPPYDVLTPDEQAQYHQSHPNNILHLDLGAQRPDDLSPFDWHHRAAVDFNRWLAEGVLIRHEKPAVYYTEMDFSDPHTGQRKTRHGFVCLLRLEEFGAEAKIRPHERTFSAHKAERLHHLEHVQANLSQVFTVFPDEKLKSRDILKAGVKGQPLFSLTDTQGQGHRLWPVWDRSVIRALSEYMLDKTVYIADGHHRYETALNYRRLKAEQGIQIGPRSPLNYLMVYLCPISDPGLVILPAHRMVCRVLQTGVEELEESLGRFFDIQKFSFNTVEEKTARQAFRRILESEGRKTNVIGLYTKLAKTYYLLKKKDSTVRGTALDEWPDSLQKLDTVVLTSLLLQEVLGLTEQDLDDTTRISYTSRVNDAIRYVNEGKVDLAAILNPTPMEQVQAVAEEGLIMPRKSTYFFPKVTTGLVMNCVNPFEAIEPLI